MPALTVTLTHEDIADITNDMNNGWSGPKPSQGYLEYLLCRFIKNRKGIDFFRVQQVMMEQEEKKNKNQLLNFTKI